VGYLRPQRHDGVGDLYPPQRPVGSLNENPAVTHLLVSRWIDDLALKGAVGGEGRHKKPTRHKKSGHREEPRPTLHHEESDACKDVHVMTKEAE